jgi:hypothetical protein
MTISTIMVYVDADRSSGAYLRTAAKLATEFEAKLIGIAAEGVQWSTLTRKTAPIELIEELRSEITKHLKDAQAYFHSTMKQMTCEAEWRSAMTSPLNYISDQARAADLIIIKARRDRSFFDMSGGDLDPADLVMQSGRPVLIVPRSRAADHENRSRRLERRARSASRGK